MTDHIVIIGGGPGGYEAAHVAAQLGAQVTVVDTDGVGGSAVLTDCVPSKTLIATAELMTDVAGANELGVMIGEDGVRVDLGRVNQRVKGRHCNRRNGATVMPVVSFGMGGGGIHQGAHECGFHYGARAAL